jgi:uncharacterized protein (TIGR03067 family)
MTRKLLAVAVVGLLLAADQPKDDAAKKELEKFQGNWSLVSVETNGQKEPEEQVKTADVKLTVKGDKFALKFMGQSIEGTLKIDAAAKPKSYDAKATDPQGNVIESLGIYEFDGDTLKVCFVRAGMGAARPKEFQTKEGSGATLEVFKRDKQ